MVKGKSTWKYNKLLTARRNYFDPGGKIERLNIPNRIPVTTAQMPDLTKVDLNGLKLPSSVNSGGGSSGFPSLLGMLGSAAGAVGGLVGNAISGGLDSKAGGVVNGIGNALGSVPILGGFAKGALNIVGGGVNALFGSKLNQENINSVKQSIANVNNITANASDYNELSDIIASTPGVADFNKKYIGKDGLFSNKAGKTFKDLQQQRADANARRAATIAMNAGNITSDINSNLLGSYFAFGGPMDFGGGAIDYDFMNQYLGIKELAALGKDASLGSLPNSFADGGGIHIKKANRGKFTEYCGGKVTSECIAKGKRSSSPAVRKRATFADNARKWKHAFGGDLLTHGANFDTGVTVVGNGGTHEENPYEGVPMGVDNEGTPNLVEEGETIFNDYVFSKRLKVPKGMRGKYGLRKGITFADASKKLARESEERPNDPISQNGLNALMQDLTMSQEQLKAEREGNKFANGGKVNKFSGEESGTNQMNYDFDSFLKALSGYTSSKIPGNLAGKYKPDPYIPTSSPYMLGSKSIAELEENDQYRAFTDAILANPNLEYLRALDAGVAPGVETLFDANNELKSNWRDLYTTRRYDQKGGIYHWTPLALESGISPSQVTVTENPATNNTATQNSAAKQERKKGRRYYYNTGTADKPNYVLSEEANAPLWMRNNNYFYTSSSETSEGDTDFTDYYYDPYKEPEPGKYADWLRYAPAVGFGIGAFTDALGITNKPDYGDADAVLEATARGGTYQPIKFNPIGNYLTYTPFDREFYINQMNAQSGATRRAILQNAGLNRGVGMAALLAADYNAQGQLGQLARQAEEYNLAQRQKVEEFNRGTNQINSEGFLKADATNQEALMKMRDFNLKGAMTAAQMREAERARIGAAKSANISGLFQTLGDIGFEEKNARMMDWGIRHGIYGPGVEDYGRMRRKAKGGKIKRNKSLTL